MGNSVVVQFVDAENSLLATMPVIVTAEVPVLRSRIPCGKLVVKMVWAPNTRPVGLVVN